MSRATKISDEAADWLIRLEAQTTPELWDELQKWLDADTRHRAAFVRLRVAWHRVDTFKNLRPADGTIDSDLLSRQRLDPRSVAAAGLYPLAGRERERSLRDFSPQRRRLLLAGSAVAAAGAIVWWGGIFAWESFSTAVGVGSEVVIRDGSILRLNTNTRLQAHLGRRGRTIRLARGEALFHVAPDPQRPFYVQAAGMSVRAVGTVFSVRIWDPHRIEVLVAEGRVVVASGADREGNPASSSGTLAISAGQLATMTPAGIAVVQLATNEVSRRLAWTDGHLVFEGQTLGEVVLEFNRYNAREIVIMDPALDGVRIGGTFAATDPDSFVAALQQSFAIRAEASGSTIRLLTREKRSH